MLLVHLGTPAEGDAFLGKRWPEARAVSDPNRKLFHAFDLGRWTWTELFSPRVAWAALKAWRFGVGKPVGDPLRKSGWYLVDEGRVIWSQVHEHAGEERHYAELAAAYASQAATP